MIVYMIVLSCALSSTGFWDNTTIVVGFVTILIDFGNTIYLFTTHMTVGKLPTSIPYSLARTFFQTISCIVAVLLVDELGDDAEKKMLQDQWRRDRQDEIDALEGDGTTEESPRQDVVSV